MIYAFIINPAAGQGKGARKVRAEVEKESLTDARDIRIYETAGEGDGTVLAAMIAEEAAAAGEEVSIYACGGDGTVNEVINGVVGHDNAYFGFIPVGSGNDFVRNFSDPERFKSVRRQLAAEPRDTDVLSFTCGGHEDSNCREGGTKRAEGGFTRYYINGINIGFDGNTAILAHDLKTLPLVSGTFSYILALINNLVKKKGEDLRITADGELIHDGPLLLATVANGGFCGGGFNSCPNAVLDDGLAEILVVKDLTRRKFLKLVPGYKAGKLFEKKGIDDLITYRQAREITVQPNGGSMKFVADGEIFETGTISIKLIDKAVKVLVP